MDREHVLEDQLLKERVGKAPDRGEQIEALPSGDMGGSLARGQDNGVAHEPQLGLGGDTDGQQNDLTYRANAV